MTSLWSSRGSRGALDVSQALMLSQGVMPPTSATDVTNAEVFNFSDLEGNADRLFVFHRDVEKARERLRKGDRPAAAD